VNKWRYCLEDDCAVQYSLKEKAFTNVLWYGKDLNICNSSKELIKNDFL
jgi:hypothetical protein